MADAMPEWSRQPDDAPAPRGGAWSVGVYAFLALFAATIMSVGLAAIVWVPLLLGVGIAMVAIASARRRRQALQGRNADEVKDPKHAHPSWPTRGVIDDRLPEP
jgi:Flp pilus assembly protein TadB